jgi:hypothetical protein
MRIRINWGVYAVFGVVVIGFVVAGFLAPKDALTDDGFPLGPFFWGMAAIFFLSTAVPILVVVMLNRRRAKREASWLDAQAEVLEVNDTGMLVNHQPRLAFKLRVQSPVHGATDVEMKRVIPLSAMASFRPGASIPVKVNPKDPKDVMLL